MTTDKTPSPASLPKQDPHKITPNKERVLEVAIGREVRSLRQSQRMTVTDLSEATGLSPGMLSKIENGGTSASLTTLVTLARALSVPITDFFKTYEVERGAVHVKAGEGVETVREGTRAGHQYQLLGALGANASGLQVEPYLITLSETSDRFPTFQHDGIEFLYILEGEVGYRHGTKMYHLKPGDSLFFDADAPHGPEELFKLPVRFLSVISYRNPGAGS
ncbi:XRE family transcriptional regulator [Roseovarius nubinhibens]|uniref:helix-turn-helix domain-containing protein n=1 Tax=Roseovarius nubinhibens TaxID=314263 RepID=UPI001C08D051|nr:XRE family transcriptional regulator [Roseovarius nubinhibens]MBU3000708.1 XRE family transcriptional regulator [Roseovarius nubinhibens]